MITVAALAEELAVSEGDVLEMLTVLYRGVLPVTVASGLLSDGQAADVRAILDPDGVRTAR